MLEYTEDLADACEAKSQYSEKINHTEHEIKIAQRSIETQKREIAVHRARITALQKDLKRLKTLYKAACEDSIRAQQQIINTI